MEYLMTYSWAILIIAVVLVAFYELGLLNPLAYAPKAQPGACQVFRPDGVGSAYDIDLEGECNDMLPQFVFRASGPGDSVIVPASNSVSSLLNIQDSLTITAWINIYGSPYHDIVDKEDQFGMKIDDRNLPNPCVPTDNPAICLEWDTSGDWVGSGFPIPNATFGNWMFIAVSISYNATTGKSSKYWFANGQQIGNTLVSAQLVYYDSNFTIGAESPGGFSGYGQAEWFNGTIANVQVYDKALSPAAVKAIYQGGIGGPPQDLQYLVGWWPLNGNANDYSGNLESGQIFNSSITGAWYNRYLAPI